MNTASTLRISNRSAGRSTYGKPDLHPGYGVQMADRLLDAVRVLDLSDGTADGVTRLFADLGLGDRIAADYQLLLDIRAFEIVVEGSVAEVVISAKIAGDSGRIAAARIFTARVPAPATQGPQAIAALSLDLRFVPEHRSLRDHGVTLGRRTSGWLLQQLIKLTKTEQGIEQEMLIPVRFVPLVPGQAREL